MVNCGLKRCTEFEGPYRALSPDRGVLLTGPLLYVYPDDSRTRHTARGTYTHYFFLTLII